MKIYLQGINISYLWKKKFIFKSAFLGCVTVVPRRVYFPSLFAHCHLLPAASVLLMTGLSIVDDEVPPDRRDLGPLCIVMMPKPKDQVRSQELSLCHVTKGSFNHNQSTNQSINQSINQSTNLPLSLSLSIHIYIYTYANILHIRTWESQKNTSKCPTDPVISTPVYPRGTCHAHHHFHPPTHWLRKRQSYALPAAGIRIISCLLILLFHHFPTYSCGSTSGVFNCKGQFLALFHITLQPQWASNLWFSQKLAATSCLQEDWKFGYPPDYIHPESKCFSVLELNFFFRIEPNPETQGTADDLELHCLLRFSSQTNQEDWECQRWGEENWQKIPPLCSLNTRDSFDSFAWMDYLTQRYSWWFRAPSSSPNWTGNQLKRHAKNRTSYTYFVHLKQQLAPILQVKWQKELQHLAALADGVQLLLFL